MARQSRKKPPESRPAAREAVPETLAELAPSGRTPVVGLGASAGGLAAFEAFFAAIPDQPTGLAFVLVQHLAPDHKSILAELVGRFTLMPVQEIIDGMEVQADNVYVIPPNHDLALLNGTLHLLEPGMPRGLRMPIDFFFRSLAQDQGDRAVCIILSGTGADGTLGLRLIKGEGGMAMAQSPDSVQYDGMPRSAIATGLVDFVLPPGAMFSQLEAYVRHAFRSQQSPARAHPASAGADVLKKVFVILRAQTSHDFSNYKESTIRRRLERRMALHQQEHGEDYLRLLRGSPAEVEALFRDFLIGVTSFFRDPAVFKALREEVIPQLFLGRSLGVPIRIWVCGCATGEEAYTIAMLLQDHLEELGEPYKVQIFGTDIDNVAIETARAGIYPASIAADVPSACLRRYFQQDEALGTFRIQKVIRDLLVFSEQDVIKDPPFSRLDLISCRNLLIYLNAELQKRLLPLFAYALNSQGFLLLGSAETIGDYTSLFLPVNRKLKLFKRRDDNPGAALLPLAEFLRAPVPGLTAALRPAVTGEGKLELKAFTEQALLGHYVQAGFLVNGSGEILHIVGRSGKFLEPPPGEPVLNILAMAREGLRLELTAALHRVVANKQAVLLQDIQVQGEAGMLLAKLVVRPAQAGGASYPDFYLVVLEEATPAEAIQAGREGRLAVDARIEALELALRSKEENLHTALEEMGTSNEELKSTNEEIQSVNEELQSTNEELETSKEELQAVNEELATVNGELQSKVVDLTRANNDMNNLLSSTGVGVLVLDAQLCVSRFTPAIAQVINLLPTDVGRSVAHFTSNLSQYPAFFEDIQAVLETLIPREVEVMTRAGAWYLLRIRPYRTADNVIEGLVLTCVDITGRKHTEEVLRQREAQSQAVEAARLGLVWQDLQGDQGYVSPELRSWLGLAPEPGDRVEQLLARLHPEDVPRFGALKLALFDAQGPGVICFDGRFRCAGGEYRRLLGSAALTFRDTPTGRVPERLILICHNLTMPV